MHLKPLPRAKTASTQTNVSVLEHPNFSFSGLKQSNLHHNSYRPMVTFAPEKKECNADKLPQPNHDYMSQEHQLSTFTSEEHYSGLPFDFMPHPKQVHPNNLVVARKKTLRPSLVVGAVVTILRHVGNLAINFCIFFTGALLTLVPNESGDRVFPATPQKQEDQPAVTSTSKKSLRQRTAEKSNHPKAKPLVQSNPRTIQRSKNTPVYVKNPKGLLPSTPLGLDSLFQLQEGEWRCTSCNFKNSGDAFTCDCCLALKRVNETSSSEEALCPPDGSPSAMSCDSYSSVPKGDEVASQADTAGEMKCKTSNIISNTRTPIDSAETKKRSTDSHDDGNYKRINKSKLNSNTQHYVEDMNIMDTT